MDTHIHVYIYVHAFVYVYIYVYAYTHRNTYTQTHTHTHTHTRTHTPCKLSQTVFSVETQSQEGGISTMFKMKGKRHSRIYRYVP